MTGAVPPDSSIPQLLVTVGTRVYPVDAPHEFTFGRAPDNTYRLDGNDLETPRYVGALTFHVRHWWVVNRSTRNSLTVFEDGLRVTLAPGESRLLFRPITLWAAGRGRGHWLDIDLPAVSGGYRRGGRAGRGSRAAGADRSAPASPAWARDIEEPLLEPLFRAGGPSEPMPAPRSPRVVTAPRSGGRVPGPRGW
ncbi:hypothetical protein FRACA_340032 [Frankia canadensis]|uniref:FHA domain-containing protein n=1 Tax=Frankia canadensis TaxID=1836972 RepID=A0A2I2KV44_9ACTN|nr:hypothetical protein FRACA_340032 [Frankia canadensis]SOU56812.1 hypothetical protein FRACA_340032 [Frankia canadensis]